MRSHFYSFVVALAFALGVTVTIQAQNVLFRSDSAHHVYYRIPAIVSQEKHALVLR